VGNRTSSFFSLPRCAFDVAIDELLALHLDHFRLVVADLDTHAAARCCDRQLLFAELADQVERLLRRSLMRKPQRVRRDVLLDRSPHLWRRREEAIRRHQAVERLMRTMEVVRLHEEGESPLAVDEVVEHRLRQELVP